MNSLIEIHDSELARVAFQGRDLVVSLVPAYVHCSVGRPGEDAGTGWVQDLDLVISEAVVESMPSVLPSRLSDGSITIDQTPWNNLIPLPLDVVGEVLLKMITEECENLIVKGTGATIVTRGELRYIEEFPG